MGMDHASPRAWFSLWGQKGVDTWFDAQHIMKHLDSRTGFHHK